VATNKVDAVDVRLPFTASPPPPPPRPFPLSNSAELHKESLLCNAANRLLVVVGGGGDNGEFVINCGAPACVALFGAASFVVVVEGDIFEFFFLFFSFLFLFVVPVLFVRTRFFFNDDDDEFIIIIIINAALPKRSSLC
jgi:hypothetical protein